MMRHVPFLVGGLAMFVLAGGARADDGAIKLTLYLGQKTALKIMSLDSRCDDPKIVKFDRDDDGIWVMGLELGSTVCSFSQVPGIRRVYEINVVEKPKEKPAKPGTK
jgi:hypothetical protein